jgi:hypothetical protein
MHWTVLSFGKHSGKSLPQVLFSDPDWFFWAMDEGVFDKRPTLKAEADLLSYRAKHIKPPATKFPDPKVEYVIHRPSMKFSHFEIVPSDREPHVGSSPTWRSDAIDMSFPRRMSSYDKTGCKSLVLSLKHHFFGSKSARVTKERAEAFFDDLSKFS